MTPDPAAGPADGTPESDLSEPFVPKPCPICRKPSAAIYAPFCSKRCADVDLGRWLGGVYAVPADEPGQTDPEDEV